MNTVGTGKNSPAGATAGQAFRSAAENLRETVGDALDRGKSDLSATADEARQTLSEDVARLKDDLQQLQKTVAGFASNAGGAAASTVKDVGQAVVSQVGSVASQAAAAATDQAKTVTSELEGMARRNPLGTLAGTLLVGVILGMISRGRR